MKHILWKPPNLWYQFRCIFKFCFLLPWSFTVSQADKCFLAIIHFAQELWAHYHFCNLSPKMLAYFLILNVSFKNSASAPAACKKAWFKSAWKQNLGFYSEGNLNLWGLFGFSRKTKISSWLESFLFYSCDIQTWHRNEWIFVVILVVCNYHR